jgi:hypothetical protein
MKVRLTVPVASCPAPIRPGQTQQALTRSVASPTAFLRAGRAGRAAAGAAGATLLAVTVAACSGGGSPSSTAPSVFTPSPHVTTSSTASGGTVRTPSPSSGGTGRSSAAAKPSDTPTSSARATSTGKATATTRPTATVTPTSRPSATATPTARPTGTATPTRRPSATPSATPKATPRVTHHPSPTPTRYYPVGAPQTGGGGTAGLQDVTLFGVGGAAILAGFGSLGYRRRLTRKRRAEADACTSAPTHTTVH